jgi:hypothetical protein
MQLSFCFFVKRASKACILLISWTSTGDIIDMAPSITKKNSEECRLNYVSLPS